MVHDIYLAYHIFRFRGNMGLSKFILIFTEINESNKVLLSEENTYDWYNLIHRKTDSCILRDQTVSQG